MRRSRATIDSLSAQNASLQRQMITFERISAEKDTLLREVRDAHILIEAVAEQLKHMDGSPAQLEAFDSTTQARRLRQSRRRGGGGRRSCRRDPGRAYCVPRLMWKLEHVRRRLADVEDSSRVRGQRCGSDEGQ